MAVPKFEYFPTRAAFDTARGATTVFNNSVVFIEDTMELFTHGHFWTVSNLSQYYNSSTQKLQLKNGSTVISELDASPFIKDGMLDSVELVTTAEQGDTTPVPYLKLTFNTVQGEPTHTVIKVSIAELFIVYNGDNVLLSSNYAKAQVYAEPAAGDKVDIAVGKLAKGISDNAAAIATKQATITGAASTITTANLTTSKIIGSDANGKVAATSIATADAEDAVSKRHTQNTDTKIVSPNGMFEISTKNNAIDVIYGNSTALKVESNKLYVGKFLQIATNAEFNSNASVTGNLSVSGNLNVVGKETVEEIVNIKSENNFITLRDGAQTAIASGSLSGTKVENYDGLGNDLLFGTDASGVFRIGDDGGTPEPIATRDEASNLTDGQAMTWDATNQRLIGKTIDSTPTSASTNLITSDGVKTAIDIAPRFYLGTCSTAGNVAIKQVDIPNFPTTLVNGVETPIVGSVIAVKFSNTDAETSAQKKIKVNNTSAYPVWYDYEERATTTAAATLYGRANAYVFYLFNGTHWVWINWGADNNTTYSPPTLGFGYASCTTAAATAAKTASLSNYNLVNGGLVVVYFQYDVPAQATLNINSKGAKEIHFGSSRITSGVIKAGDKCLFIYNGNYMLIAIDRWGKELQEKVSGINISETDFEALSTFEQGKLYFVYDDNNNS